MNKLLTLVMAAMTLMACGGQKQPAAENQTNEEMNLPTVYFTKDITPESLVKIYKALGLEATGRVAVKISTGEGGNPHYLKPELIGQHWETIRDHGFDQIARVDLMDEEGEMQIPVADSTHLKYDIVGNHLVNYDFMINLAHFKGHAMGGFGGVLKNASIGVASTNGKAYIHSAGKTTDSELCWTEEYCAQGPTQDLFLESMAAAAQAVHKHFDGKILYIDVMNNMSVDCDCDGNPAKPELLDMGIMASLDPVAVDQACLDKVFNYEGHEGDDNQPLIERINRQHGTYITDYAERIGLGSKKYKLVEL